MYYLHSSLGSLHAKGRAATYYWMSSEQSRERSRPPQRGATCTIGGKCWTGQRKRRWTACMNPTMNTLIEIAMTIVISMTPRHWPTLLSEAAQILLAERASLEECRRGQQTARSPAAVSMHPVPVLAEDSDASPASGQQAMMLMAITPIVAPVNCGNRIPSHIQLVFYWNSRCKR